MDTIQLPDGVTSDLPSIEDRYDSAVRGLMMRIKSLYDAIIDRFGLEGLELIREISGAEGDAIADKLLARGQRTDLKSITLLLARIFENVRGIGEVTELTDQRGEIMISRCPYPFDSADVCRAHTTMEERLVHRLNPNLRYQIEACIPRGDKYCLHVVTTWEISASETRQGFKDI